ncbi:MAG: hypothetical protein DRJ36_00860 [Thermoprotei archaeon]|nr:MAG: hypothetical protein DRJ36_00860 [Thermoprotei archaeon]
MDEGTRRAVKEYMLSYALNFIRSRRGRVDEFIEKALRKYPFHTIFFPLDYIVISEVERSITTGIGLAFYTGIAERIAKGRYSDVEKDRTFHFELDEAKVRKIDDILEALDRKKRAPSVEGEIREIMEVAPGKKVGVDVTADFYIGDYEYRGERLPVLIEFKTPWPKKEDCVRSKRRMLLFRLAHGFRALAFIGFPYNPFKRKEDIWWTTKQFFDLDREVLSGKDLWDFIGGSSTYDELVVIAEEVSREVRPEVDALVREVTTQVERKKQIRPTLDEYFSR